VVMTDTRMLPDSSDCRRWSSFVLSRACGQTIEPRFPVRFVFEACCLL